MEPSGSRTVLGPGQGWAADFQARVEAAWTEARWRELVGDKELPLELPRDGLLLRSVGLLDRQAEVPAGQLRKLFQVNHLLRNLRPALREAAEQGPFGWFDVGCGSSALGLVLAGWAAREGLPLRLLGLDRNAGLLRSVERRIRAAGLGGHLRVVAADAGTASLEKLFQQAFPETTRLDGLLALHACDQATDWALVLAWRAGLRFVAVAPCCQAELAAAWGRRLAASPPPPLGGLWASGHLRRELAATVTDGLRAAWLADQGYEVRATEFVDGAHTPKNTLLRAWRRNPPGGAGYPQLVAATGGVGLAVLDAALEPRPLER